MTRVGGMNRVGGRWADVCVYFGQGGAGREGREPGDHILAYTSGWFFSSQTWHFFTVPPYSQYWTRGGVISLIFEVDVDGDRSIRRPRVGGEGGRGRGSIHLWRQGADYMGAQCQSGMVGACRNKCSLPPQYTTFRLTLAGAGSAMLWGLWCGKGGDNVGSVGNRMV